MTYKWNFRVISDSQVKQDPIQSEFFTSDKTAGYTSGLVRECIQNSIDARDDDNYPVEVRFKITENFNSFGLNDKDSYLYGLKEHLEAKKNGLRVDLNTIREKGRCLIIEDANTTGLQGNPLQADDKDDVSADKQSFYYFWRNVGRSGKGNQDKGRWGLGKTVIPASSLINTFFGMSVSKENQKKTFMGQSILKTHYVDNSRHSPYGYYAEFEIEHPDPDFAMPVKDSDFHAEVEKKFDLIRSDNSGLSIIIPYIRSEVSLQNILKDVVEQYYYAILSGELKVDLEDEEESIAINKTSLLEVIGDLEFEDEQSKKILIHKVEFTKWALKINEEDIFEFHFLPLDHQPRWVKDKLIPEEKASEFAVFKERFTTGDRISFKIPIKSHLFGEEPQQSYFKVFIQYVAGSDVTYTEYIRDGITISGVNGFSKDGFSFLLIVDDKPISTLLGDSENPAHTEWQRKSSHFRNKYQDGEETISFVIRAPEILYNWLYVVPETVKQDLLNEFLSISEKQNGKYEKKEKKDLEGESEDGPDEEIESRKSLVNITKLKDGVKVIHGGRDELNRVILKFAYDLRRKDPFKKYDTIDFDLSKSPMSISQTGLSLELNQGNTIIFNPNDKEYSLEITGFDKNRDIKVSARKYD